MHLLNGRLRLIALACLASSLAAPRADAVDVATWPLRAIEGTRTTETAEGFDLQPSTAGTPFGFTLQASRAAADSGGSDTKVGPVPWMAPENISGISVTGGFGFADGSIEFLRVAASIDDDGVRFDLEVLGDRLGQGAVYLIALENGNPGHIEAATEATSPLFEGSSPPSGGGATGSAVGAAFESRSGGSEAPLPTTADRPGGGALALRFEPGTTLTFGDVTVTADEVRVGIWGTTGTLFDVEELGVVFTPAVGTAPSIHVIDGAMGLNGHEVRLGSGARGEIVRDADDNAVLALRASAAGAARVSTVLRPGQRGVTMRCTDADGNALATPPASLTHQGRLLDTSAAKRRGDIVYGVRATTQGDQTSYVPVLDDPGARYTVRWERADGSSGSTTASTTFPETSSRGAWPSEWTLPAMESGNEVEAAVRFASPVDLTVGSNAVSDAVAMRIEILMTLTADPLVADVETNITGLSADDAVFVSYTETDLGPGTSSGSPTAQATGRAFLQRADDGTVLVGGLSPAATDPVDGVEFGFDPTEAAGIEFAAVDAPRLVVRCAGVAASDPTATYEPLEVLVESLGGDEYAVRVDASSITAAPELDYEVLDGEGRVIDSGKVVHRDIAARVIGTPADVTVVNDGIELNVRLKVNRPTDSRTQDVVAEVRVFVPQSDFLVQTLQLAGDGGAFFAQGRTLEISTDAPPVQVLDARLHKPFPNPFNPRTSVRFVLSRATDMSLRILDTRGRVVDVLAEGRLEAGTHTRTWDGTDRDGRPVASGTYFLRLGDGTGMPQVRKMTLVR